MLMRVKVDFHYVEEHQREIDKDLVNWSRWVTPSSPSQRCQMFKWARSNSWQWHTPEYRESCDPIAAQAMEKKVCQLPDKHKAAIIWFYVRPTHPHKAQRALGVTEQALYGLVRDGRQMLMNREV